MKIGCLINLAIYGALVAGYYHWLEPTVESPAIWITSCVAGLLTLMALGALYNSWNTLKDRRALENARDGLSPLHGNWAAVVGRIEPLGESLVAPFSHQECVICEYEISRTVERQSSDSSGSNSYKAVDFSGIHMVPCAIQQGYQRVQLLGFPNLDHIPSQGFSYYGRAKNFVQQTNWADCTGMKALLNVRAMWNTLTEAEASFRHDWRSIDIEKCPWLDGSDSARTDEPSMDRVEEDASAAEEESDWDSEDDREDADSETREFSTFGKDEDLPSDSPSSDNLYYRPRIEEKRIDVGDEVVALGPYDAIRGALVSAAKKDGQMIRIYRDRLPVVQQKLAGSTYRLLLGGLIGLVVIHGGLYLGHLAYCSNEATQREWREQLVEAVKAGDQALAAKILDRGVDIDSPDDEGKTVLMFAKDPAMISFLKSRNANLNAQDKKGFTAVMYASLYGHADLLKPLIEAGADLNLKNTEYGTTALMIALGSERAECVELLRAAGAQDDTVTADNGEKVLSADPPFVAVQEYVRAIHAHDAERVKALSTYSCNFDYNGVDWDIWSESRPASPRLVEGFVRGDDATVTVNGITPKAFHTTWVYQLKRVDGEWKVARERWVTKN